MVPGRFKRVAKCHKSILDCMNSLSKYGTEWWYGKHESTEKTKGLKLLMKKVSRRRIAFLWEQYGPYHMDRCEAVGVSLRDEYETIGIEITTQSETYAWDETADGHKFRKITLFPGYTAERVSKIKLLLKLIRIWQVERPEVVFMCHYQRFTILLASFAARMFGARVVVLNNSKFDDKPRSIHREVLKRLFLLPYSAALVSGRRSAEYFAWLGIRPDRILLNYNSLSIERVRSYVDTLPAPEGTPYEDRCFLVVARFVPKKSLLTTLAAYKKYCELESEAGRAPRKLVLCGDGELRSQLENYVAKHSLDNVEFTGFIQAEEISVWMSKALALILMSEEEQWGNVINESLAWGLPVLCSINCGAVDLLVRPDVNGYIYPVGESDGVAQSMFRLASVQSEWDRMARNALETGQMGDVSNYVKSVRGVIKQFNP